MDHREQERPPLAPGGAAWQSLGAARERAGFFVQQRLLWPIEDRAAALGPRGRIGVLGGGAVAVGAVVAALLIGGGGSGSGDGTTAVAVVPSTSVAPRVTPAPKPKPKKKAAKPAGPTLHGAPPDFSPAKDVKAGVSAGKAVEKGQKASGTAASSGEAPAERSAATGAGDAPASTAKIGANPAASAAGEARASSLATGSGGDGTGNEGAGAASLGSESAVGTGTAGAGSAGSGSGSSAITGPPAPKAAKQTARRFAEAFVVYEVGGVDGKVRSEFRHTTTEQLSRSLLHRPPRQPAAVKVPGAKVVNVVAGPSQGTVYSVSVSLLRVGVTSELRLELEQGPGKKWQVTNVLG